MARTGILTALLLFLLAGLPGCSARSASERAGTDQEIVRNILWRFHQDASNRFRDVRVTCEDRVITLEGRVGDTQAAADALQIARNESRGGKVDSRLEVRLR